jgi:dihydroorotase
MIEKLSTNPAKVIGKSDLGTLKVGAKANVTIFDPEEEFKLTRETIRSKSVNTPFLNRTLRGRVKWTVYNGKIVFKS